MTQRLEGKQLTHRVVEPLQADVEHRERQAEQGGRVLGEALQLVVGVLRQPHHAGVVPEVVVAQLGIAIQPELLR